MNSCSNTRQILSHNLALKQLCFFLHTGVFNIHTAALEDPFCCLQCCHLGSISIPSRHIIMERQYNGNVMERNDYIMEYYKHFATDGDLASIAISV